MKTIKKNIQIAATLCFLLYITCYLRFIGQAFLEIITIFSAITLTYSDYLKPLDHIKKLRVFWIIKFIHITLFIAFYKTIMWNDFLQISIVTIVPNLMVIYLIHILNRFIHYENIIQPNDTL